MMSSQESMEFIFRPVMVKQFLFSLMISTLDMLTERPNFRHLKINLKSNFQSLL